MPWGDPSGHLDPLPIRDPSFSPSDLLKLQHPLTIVREYVEVVLVKEGVSLRWDSTSLVPMITKGGKGTVVSIN
jgi:hypothetical protein